MFRRLLPALFVFSCTLFLPVAAAADTIAIGGTYTSSGPIPTIGYGLFGQGFSMSARASTVAGINNPFCAQPCPAGRSVNLSGSSFIIAGDFNFPSTITVNGVTYDFLTTNFSAQFNFLSEDRVIPIGSGASVVLTAPFTATGGVGGRTLNNQTVLFSVSLTGSGVASLTMTQDQFGSYRFDRITYAFSTPPTPTPEPTTLILFGSGLSGIVAAKLRRR